MKEDVEKEGYLLVHTRDCFCWVTLYRDNSLVFYTTNPSFGVKLSHRLGSVDLEGVRMNLWYC
jgi:hypothetical protein